MLSNKSIIYRISRMYVEKSWKEEEKHISILSAPFTVEKYLNGITYIWTSDKSITGSCITLTCLTNFKPEKNYASA